MEDKEHKVNSFLWKGPGHSHELHAWTMGSGDRASDFFGINTVTFGLTLGHDFMAVDVLTGSYIVRNDIGVYTIYTPKRFNKKFK